MRRLLQDAGLEVGAVEKVSSHRIVTTLPQQPHKAMALWVSHPACSVILDSGDDVGTIDGASLGAGAPALPHARNVYRPPRPQARQRWLQG